MNEERGKSKYRQLKISILLRTVFIIAITGVIGTFVMVYFVDGFFSGPLPRFFVRFFGLFGTSESRAREIYWSTIGNNSMILIVILFTTILLIILYVMLSAVTRQLEEVEDCIDQLDSDRTEPFELIEELGPVEDKLNEIKETLQQRKQAAIESEKKKSDLVLFLAHDLKTPLTSIIAYLSRLDMDPDMDSEDRKKYIHIASQKSLRLGELIQEFFEITQFNMNGFQLEFSVINLSIMLEQLADELYAVLKQKELTCEVQSDEDILLYGDPDKLARVFDNLLRNAVSYSHVGTKISIVAKEVGGWIEIVFSNRGQTIPEENLKTIFEKFYRMDAARSSETGGAGLGLAIAKEIVELHGGQISATSIDGLTSFIVVLPQDDEQVRLEKERKLKRRLESAIKEEKIKVHQ